MVLSAPTTSNDLARLIPFNSIAAERRVDFISPEHDLDFARPFWHMTMEKLEALDKQDQLEKVSISFDELRRLVGTEEPRPIGMIFHIGRCGSTPVSRMVGHDPSTLVLREASPIGGLHRASSGSDRVPTYTIEQAFKDVLVAFDRFAASRRQRTVVKHSSWESFSMARVAEILPETPLVFVYRNPIETVESSLDGHPGWAGRIHEPIHFLARWVPWIERVPAPFTAAAVYASVWAAGASAALSLPASRVHLIEHATLTAEPRSSLEGLKSHLGLDIDIDGALGELDQYSKAPDDGTTFNPSGEHRHPSLSARTRAHVLDIVGDLPEQLAERLTDQRASLSHSMKGA